MNYLCYLLSVILRKNKNNIRFFFTMATLIISSISTLYITSKYDVLLETYSTSIEGIEVVSLSGKTKIELAPSILYNMIPKKDIISDLKQIQDTYPNRTYPKIVMYLNETENKTTNTIKYTYELNDNDSIMVYGHHYEMLHFAIIICILFGLWLLGYIFICIISLISFIIMKVILWMI